MDGGREEGRKERNLSALSNQSGKWVPLSPPRAPYVCRPRASRDQEMASSIPSHPTSCMMQLGDFIYFSVMYYKRT